MIISAIAYISKIAEDTSDNKANMLPKFGSLG